MAVLCYSLGVFNVSDVNVVWYKNGTYYLSRRPNRKKRRFSKKKTVFYSQKTLVHKKQKTKQQQQQISKQTIYPPACKHGRDQCTASQLLKSCS